MVQPLKTNFSKEVITLPDGRRLIYYNFDPEPQTKHQKKEEQ